MPYGLSAPKSILIVLDLGNCHPRIRVMWSFLYNHKLCCFHYPLLVISCFCVRPPRGIIHVSSRFRRDPRALEEEEESWFDQDDEEEQNGGGDVITPVISPEETFKAYNNIPKKSEVLPPSPSNKVRHKCLLDFFTFL